MVIVVVEVAILCPKVSCHRSPGGRSSRGGRGGPSGRGGRGGRNVVP
jgi:hypothetical protein